MGKVIDRAWLQDRIDRTKSIIATYEDAIEALSTGAQMYQLDTGQTRQMVTRAQLPQLRSVLESLENRLDSLEARLCGGTTYGRPGF